MRCGDTGGAAEVIHQYPNESLRDLHQNGNLVIYSIMRKRLKRVLGFSNMPNAPISTQDHLPPSSLFSSVGPTTWTSGSTADTIRGPRATTHFTDDAQLREEGEGIVTTGTGLRALLDLRGGQVGGWGDEGKCILDPRLKPTGVVVGHNRRTDWDEEMRRQLYETDPDPWGVQSKKGGADAEVVPIPPPKPSPFMPLPLIDATDSWLQSAIKAPGTKFDDYKLETEFRDGFMVDTMHKWELSTRLWEKLTWKQLNFIRTGACGGGWLEKESRGKLRAVKKLRRWSTKTTDVSREVLALVKLKDVSTPVGSASGERLGIGEGCLLLHYCSGGSNPTPPLHSCCMKHQANGRLPAYEFILRVRWMV